MLIIFIFISAIKSSAFELIPVPSHNTPNHATTIIANLVGGSAVCILTSWTFSFTKKKIARWYQQARLCARFKNKRHMQDIYDEIILKKIALQASHYSDDNEQSCIIDRLLKHYKPRAHSHTVQGFKEIAITYTKSISHAQGLNTMTRYLLPFIVHHERLNGTTIEAMLATDPEFAQGLPEDKEDLVEFLLRNAQEVITQWGAQKHILKMAVFHAIKRNQFDLKDAENYLAYHAGAQKNSLQFPVDAHAIRQQQLMLSYLSPNHYSNPQTTVQEHIHDLQTRFLNQEEIEFLALQ